jgi:transcriptional regulator with XRE-family HTH domain
MKRGKMICCSEDVTGSYTIFMKEIGLRLYILRIERELSATVVARALGMTPSVLRQIEKGGFNWTTEFIKKILDYYESHPKLWDILSKFPPHNIDVVFKNYSYSDL